MDLSERPSGSAFARHPWELSRFRFFRRVLSDAGLVRAKTFLDVGAGDAWFASELIAEHGEDVRVTCWDVSYTAQTLAELEAAKDSRLTFVAERPKTAAEVVLLLDVLEHIEDDVGFLRDIVDESVTPGGWVLVSVPAWQGLYCAHDKGLRHYRRYAPQRARELVLGSGLEITRSGGLFHSLLLPRAVTKAKEVLLPNGETPPQRSLEWDGRQWQARVVDGALALDNQVSHWFARVGIEVPGLSWWGLCKKR
jgi:Methyltransferase domain